MILLLESNNMLIDYITDFCNTQYKKYTNCDSSPRCKQCNHPTTKCSGDCGDCLYQIHFLSNKPEARHLYNCKNLTNFYVCKYSFKYTSEIIYALMKCSLLKKVSSIKVLSFGCGPCTDLFAIDYLHNVKELSYNKLSYVGVDLLKDQWEMIHTQIKKYMLPNKVNFFYKDATSLLDAVFSMEGAPNLIILQYFFSDFHKHSSYSQVNVFIDKLVNYINTRCNKTYIIINDINLCCAKGGGRDYFDVLCNKLRPNDVLQLHFNNSNRQNHYDYGKEYCENKIFFDIEMFEPYDPFDSCASAQMLMYKE